MRIGIFGSGLMGGKLGTLFARAGHEVVFSYSRSHKKLELRKKRAPYYSPCTGHESTTC
jgi:8-hydroxy-5-deazaflavin:NADPH oxidoreductase